MQIQVTRPAGAAVMTVKGRMDAVTAQDFDRAFDALIQEKAVRIVLHFGGLEYISSAGLRSVLAAGKKAKSAQGSLVLCGLNGMVREVFEISGFATMLPLFDTEEAALKSLA
jgi:anti-anti-sigma factor